MDKVEFVNKLYENVYLSLYLDCPKYARKLWYEFSDKEKTFLEQNDTVAVDDTIKIFLLEILNHEDERYILALSDYFINKVNKKLNPSENLKLSLISVMYQFSKNDFENYQAFLDDIMSMKIDSYLNYYIGFDIVSLYKSLEILFKNPYYKNNNELRQLFRSSNKIFTSEYQNTLLENKCCKLKTIDLIVRKIGDKELKEKAFNLLFSYSFNNVISLDSLLFLLDSSNTEFFFSNLFKVEDNQEIQKEFLNLVNNLKTRMFKDLDNILGENSFCKIFKIIFDSDSYRELYKNMGLLESANYKYPFDKDYLESIKMIGDKSLKEIYRGRVVSYPEGSINMVIKPDRIIDRMKALYFRIDDSYDYDFLDNIHKNSNSVFDVFDRIYFYMCNPLNKIKQKIKRKKTFDSSEK